MLCESDLVYLDTIKERCANWYACYRDRPRVGVSNLFYVLRYLETYGTPAPASLSEKLSPPPRHFELDSSSPPRSPLNQRDADLLQLVWKELDDYNRKPLMVGYRFRLLAITPSDIKRIVAIYVFGSRRYRTLARSFRRTRLRRVSAQTYQNIEDLCLVYFAKQVEWYELLDT